MLREEKQEDEKELVETAVRMKLEELKEARKRFDAEEVWRVSNEDVVPLDLISSN